MARFEKEDSPISPKHYKLFPMSDLAANEIEAIDVLQAALTREEFGGYLKGNMLKYLIRHKNKNGEEDIKKSNVYMRLYNEMQVLPIQE